MDNVILAMFSPQDLFLVLIVALFLFGPKRLPEIGEAIGKTIQSFKGAIGGGEKAALNEGSKTERKA